MMRIHAGAVFNIPGAPELANLIIFNYLYYHLNISFVIVLVRFFLTMFQIS